MIFPTTHWTVLKRASLNGDTQSKSALEQLCQDYWKPLHSEILRRGVAQDDARDVTQGFMCSLITSGSLDRANRHRGRFRNYLNGALTNFLIDQQRQNLSLKRGGREKHISAEFVDDELSVPAPESSEFDKEWAFELLTHALAVTEREIGPETFATLKHFLPGGGAPSMAYETAAQILGWPVNTLKVEVLRLRQRLRDNIRLEVTRTVCSPAEIDEEMAYLHAILLSA